MKIILLRHGDIIRGKSTKCDQLTLTAKHFAKMYPNKLKEYNIKTIYYNNKNDKGENINRCKETVKHFKNITKKPCGFKKTDIDKLLKDITKTSLICYRMATLKYLPKIKKYNRYLYDTHTKKKGIKWEKQDKDSLYEKIFILEKKDGELIHLKTICTGTFRGDESKK